MLQGVHSSRNSSVAMPQLLLALVITHFDTTADCLKQISSYHT